MARIDLNELANWPPCAGARPAFGAADAVRAVLASVDRVIASEHPLGFLHLELTPLVGLSAGERLRMHLWDASCEPHDELGLLHDHVWSLESSVLVGELSDSEYLVYYCEDGEYDEISIRYGRTIVRESTGRKANLSSGLARDVAAGDCYAVAQH